MKIRGLLLLLFLSHFLYSQEVKGRFSRDVLTKAQSKPLSNQPLFIENKNQWSDGIQYFIKTRDQNFWLTNQGFRADMHQLVKYPSPKIEEISVESELDSGILFGHVWDFILLNKNANSFFQNIRKQSFYHNYFIGNDSNKWASKVSLYESVLEKNVYTNIDLHYYLSEKKDLEYDFIIHPGGSVQNIKFLLSGLDNVKLDDQGDILLNTTYFGAIPLTKPHTFQYIDGKKVLVKSKYLIQNDTISIQVGDYNLNYDLIVDPVVKYSTYIDCIGCTSCTNYSYDIDVNDSLEAIITGKTYYNTYPVTTGAYKSTSIANQYDIYLTKLTANGDNLLYSTFFGGSSGDYGYGVAYDSAQNIIFTGNTQSIDFPLNNNLYPPLILSTTLVPFIAKLDSSGGVLMFSSVINSTVNGGGRGSSIIADKNLNIYVTGYTNSASFPTTAGAIRTTFTSQEGFLMKLNPLGGLLFSTYIGGSNSDVLRGIDLDPNGNIYVVGNSSSSDFHLSVPGYSKTKSGTSQDVVVCKLKNDGSSMLYATYIGGSTGGETGTAIAIDNNGNSYFTGFGASTNFPTTAGSFKTAPASGDIFVSSLDSSGTILRKSTAVGQGYSYGIDVDECGFVVISGYTSSPTFPITSDAFVKTVSSLENIVTVFDYDLKSLTFSTLFGGKSADYGEASVSVKRQNLIISGTTHSNDFPVTAGAYQTSRFGTNSCDAPVVYAFNKICFVTEPIVKADPLFFCDTTPQFVTLRGIKTVGGCNTDTSNVIINWTKGYQRTPIATGDSIRVFLKLNDTIFGQAVDTLNLCKSKEFQFVTQYVYFIKDTTLCFGGSIFFNGSNRTTTGIYKDTFLTGLNCDSVLILNLKILSQILITNPKTICPGDSFLWNGVYRKTPGSYRDTFLSALGCDSIVTLSLSYIPYKFTTISNTICQGDSILWNGVYIKTAGAYKDSFMSSLFCDSIVTLNLNLKYPKVGSIVIDICLGQSYSWNGNSYSLAGNYVDTLAASNGCDSFDNLILNVHEPTRDTFDANICIGSHYLWNGILQNSSGYYPDTFASIYGCDSFVWLNLIVHPLPNVFIDTPICSNQSFLWYGTHYNTADTLKDTTTSIWGCDSFTTYRLRIVPIKFSSFFDTSCLGATYIWNGVQISVSGAYLDTFQSREKCDSIVTLYLHVKPNSTYHIFDTLCQGDSVWWNNLYAKMSGQYNDTFVNHLGCDSIVILNLAIKPYRMGQINTTICALDSVEFKGQKFFTTGSFYDTIYSTNPLLCDSITTLNLTVRPMLQTHLYDTVCINQQYLWNGDTIRNSGIYKDTLISSTGCDSFLFLHHTINPKIVLQLSHCFLKGSVFTFRSKNYSIAGIYSDSTNNLFSCDTVFILQLTEITPIIESIDTFSCGTINIKGKNYFSSDSLIERYANSRGCDSFIHKTFINIQKPLRRDTLRINFCDSFLYQSKYYFCF
jgi:hypothetical protein